VVKATYFSYLKKKRGLELSRKFGYIKARRRSSRGGTSDIFEGLLRHNETEEETCAHVSMRLNGAAEDRSKLPRQMEIASSHGVFHECS